MKLIIIVSSLFFFSFSALAGQFLETFENTNLEEWQELIWLNLDIGAVSWEIINGELQGIAPMAITRLLIIGNEIWQDYDIEIDVKPLKKHGPGNIAIAARVKGTSAIWCFVGDTPTIVEEDGVPPPEPESLVSCWGGNFHEGKKSRIFKSKVHPLLKLNKWSTLKLGIHTNNLSFWINGKPVLESMVDLPGLLIGKGGLGIAGYTARFDNITITHKNGLFVQPQAKLTTTWGRLKRF
ncbi:MAG: hypothetical protein OXN25_16070 [Candidatus Poribacteria bacterium]|nr:hypothetical protein [Candidatus Poribacteria bacterium]